MTDEAKKTFLVVCAAPAVLVDGTLGFALHVINEDGKTFNTEDRIFSEKSCRKANIFVGGTYKIEATEDFRTAYIADAEYQGLWHSESDRAGWKTTERALSIARAAQKRQKSDAELNAMKEALAPIRDAYQKTNSLGRLAIEVQVLAYLRGTRIIF